MLRLEEYLTHYDDISNKNPITLDFDNVSSTYQEPIKQVPYSKTWNECIDEKIYPYLYSFDIKGQMFPDLWLNEIKNIIKTDSSVTTDYIVEAINKFQIFDKTIFKWLYENGFREFGLIHFKVNPFSLSSYITQILVITNSVSETYEVYDKSFIMVHPCVKNDNNFYSIVADYISTCDLQISLTIPDNVDIMNMESIINRSNGNTLMRLFGKTILSNYDYLYIMIHKKKYVCDEFYEKIPEIIIRILLQRPKEDITKDLYITYVKPKADNPISSEYRNTFSKHPSVLYARYYLEAPPRWLVHKDYIDEVRAELESMNRTVPIYLAKYQYKHFIPCSHYINHKRIRCWYSNPSMETIYCDKCIRGVYLPSIQRINNVRCSKCKGMSDYIYVYECGCSVCKKCYESLSPYHRHICGVSV